MGARSVVAASMLVLALALHGCAADAPVIARGGSAPGEGAGSGGEGGVGVTGPGGKACGGRAGLTCRSDEYCHHADHDQCGSGLDFGVCSPVPEICEQGCAGACGCDDREYCNECMARAAGVDVSKERACGGGSCGERARRMRGKLGRGGACTLVVRLDRASREPTRQRLVCGPTADVSPELSRTQAERDTGLGRDGQLISGLRPEDHFVFWSPPSTAGGVAAVSARTGLTVFGGTIVWDGEGRVVHPVTFETPAALGPRCGSSAPRPPARGFDLLSLDELSAADVQAALDGVWSTGAPDALSSVAALLSAMVLLYPPRVGVEPDASLSEWVVLLDAAVR